MAIRASTVMIRNRLFAVFVALALPVVAWAPGAGAEEATQTTNSQSYDTLRFVFEFTESNAGELRPDERDDVVGGDAERLFQSLLVSLGRAWPDAELERASDWYSFENLSAVEDRVALGMPSGTGVVLVRLEDTGGGGLSMDMRFYAELSVRLTDHGSFDELRERFARHFRRVGENALGVSGGVAQPEAASPVGRGAAVAPEPGHPPMDAEAVQQGNAHVNSADEATPSTRPAEWVPRRDGLRLSLGLLSLDAYTYDAFRFGNSDVFVSGHYPDTMPSFSASYERAHFWRNSSFAMVYGGGAMLSRGLVRDAFDVEGEVYDLVVWRFGVFGHVTFMWSNATRRLRHDRFSVSFGPGVALRVNAKDRIRARPRSGEGGDVSLDPLNADDTFGGAAFQVLLRFDLPRKTGVGVAFDVRIATTLDVETFDAGADETRTEVGVYLAF